MPVRTEPIVVDGVTRQHYIQDPPDPDKPLHFTGPVRGTVTLADGTSYDVTPDVIEVASQAHAAELRHHAGLTHERDGHPSHLPRTHPDFDPLRDEFVHVCDAACGESARTPDQVVADFEERLRRHGHGDLVGGDAHSARVAALRSEHQRIQEG